MLDINSKKVFHEFKAFVQKVAKKKRDDAGFMGSWSDGGAEELLANFECFEAGIELKIPKPLKEVWNQYNKSVATANIDHAELERVKEWANRNGLKLVSKDEDEE